MKRQIILILTIFIICLANCCECAYIQNNNDIQTVLPEQLATSHFADNVITYVNINAMSNEEGDSYYPVSYIKNCEQQLIGDMGAYNIAQGNILLDLKPVSNLQQFDGIASNGGWNFFPIETSYKEYSLENQPVQKKWGECFSKILTENSISAPVIYIKSWEFQLNDKKSALVIISNVLFEGCYDIIDANEFFEEDCEVSDDGSGIYMISALFIGDNVPIVLYDLHTTLSNNQGLLTELPSKGKYQQPISAVLYSNNDEIVTLPVYCTMNGEYIIREYCNIPAYMFCDTDGDGTVELISYEKRSSSAMSVCKVYEMDTTGVTTRFTMILN